MDDQLEQAVDIALKGTSDSSLRQQVCCFVMFCQQAFDLKFSLLFRASTPLTFT